MNKDDIPKDAEDIGDDTFVVRGGSKTFEDADGEVVVEVPTSDSFGEVQDGEECPLSILTISGSEECDKEFNDATVMHKTPKYRKRRYNQKDVK